MYLIFLSKCPQVHHIHCSEEEEEEEGTSEKKVTETQTGPQNRNDETNTKDHIQNQACQVRLFIGYSSVLLEMFVGSQVNAAQTSKSESTNIQSSLSPITA